MFALTTFLIRIALGFLWSETSCCCAGDKRLDEWVPGDRVFPEDDGTEKQEMNGAP